MDIFANKGVYPIFIYTPLFVKKSVSVFFGNGPKQANPY